MADQFSIAFASWLAFLASADVETKRLLNPPATIEQIRDVEQNVGYPLPDDLVQLYLTANGQATGKSPVALSPGKYTAALFGRHSFISVDEAYREWATWKEVAENYPEFDDEVTVKEGHPVAKKDFQPSWFPFASDWSGNAWAVDLNPPAGGTPGQVIVMGRDEYERRVIASSLTELFNMAAATLDRDNLHKYPGTVNRLEFEMDWNQPPIPYRKPQPPSNPRPSALTDHLHSMNRWIDEHHPGTLPKVVSQMTTNFFEIFGVFGINEGNYLQFDYEHPLRVALSIEKTTRHPEVADELDQVHEAWRLIHLWCQC